MPAQVGCGPVDDDHATAGGVELGILDAVEAEMDDIERALARLEDGTYGTCEVCGERLSSETLHERPAARRCRAHLPMALG